MKALLFLLTILFAVWLWRRSRLNSMNQRQADTTQTGTEPKPTAASNNPSPMQACLHCGLHMPTSDMVQGQRGHYCSQAHCVAASDTSV